MKFLKEKKKRGASDSPLYAHSLLSYLHRVEREGKRSSARVLLPLFFLSALKSKKIKKNCDIKKQTNTQQRVKAAPSFIILHFPFFFECEVALGEPLARCWPTHFPVCSIFFVKRGKEREKEKQFVVSREGGEERRRRRRRRFFLNISDSNFRHRQIIVTYANSALVRVKIFPLPAVVSVSRFDFVFLVGAVWIGKEKRRERREGWRK